MVSLLILLSMSMFHVCCSNDNKMMNEVLISSFTVWSGEQKIDAVIDNEQQKIMISGIEDGNQITNIEYALTSGVTFYPEPHTFLNNWKKEMNLVARTTDNQKVYTIVLKDYEKPLNNALKIKLDERKQQIMLVGGDMERSQFFLQKAAVPEEIAQCAASYTGQFLKEKYL